MQESRGVWHTIREYVGHWFWTGVFVASTGATPDHVFADAIEQLHVSEYIQTS
jgi:hypothetical protein